MTDENPTPMPEEPAYAPPAPPAAPAEAPAVPPVPPPPPAAEYAAPPAPPAAYAAPPSPPQPGYPQSPGYAPPAAGSSDKSKVVAGVLGILLGALGIHKFYLGYNKEGIIMLLVSLLTFGFLAWVMSIIGLVEGIMYLMKTDAEFEATYVYGRKPWF